MQVGEGRFLGIDAGILSKNAELGLVPVSQIVWHPNTLEPVGSGRINAWQDELSVTELETIELMNGKNLEKLGYKCSSLF
jgi:hypothetical protein